MDLEKAYKARGLPCERKYDGSEYWSDEEDEFERRRLEAAAAARAIDPYGLSDEEDEENAKTDINKNRKYVNSIAEQNYKKVGPVPTSVNEMKYVEPSRTPVLYDIVGEAFELREPLVYVPSHVMKRLGPYVVRVIWDEFLSHGATGTACTQQRNIESIGRKTSQRLNRPLPFSRLAFDVEGDDYVAFVDVLEQLSVMLNAPNDDYLEKDPPARLPSCCAFRACRKHRAPEPGKEPDKVDDDLVAPFFLETVYARWKLTRGGNLRRKHIPGILAEAAIPYDAKRLPQQYWNLYGEILVEDSVQMMEVVDAIRVDMDMHRETKQDLFRLPRWLKNEFSVSEIKLFIHHFKSIDIDGGGSIDADELLRLTESLGSKITIEEAQELIDENDEDGSGTIDFEEFMTLMFRIQHGTIDLENNRLGRAIMESKTQLAILQEIDEIHRNPPLPQISVGKYGGCPVVCEYLINGPPDSPYEEGLFKFNVRYNNGYPYNCPTVTIGTRIYCINVMPKINGDGVLDHLPRSWDCNWNSRKLLLHFYELLQEQDYSLVPTSLYNVAYSYFEQPEIRGDESVSNSLSSSKVDALKFPDLFDQLARIEQVQVNNIILHMGDRDKYNQIAKQYTRQFAQPAIPSKRDNIAEAKTDNDLDDWEDEDKDKKPA